jgi:5-formyltetrahydrofolate cyclo-ligase
MMTSTPQDLRAALRRELRLRRAGLSSGLRQRTALLTAYHLSRSRWLRAGAIVALYVASGSEAATLPLRRLAARRGCRVVLPRIGNYGERRLHFCPDRGRLHANRFRIGEPPAAAGIDPRRCVLIVLPLLGFDERGTRLGSGAGYYDRLLAVLDLQTTRRRPLLLGLAFDAQSCPPIPRAAHDVPLDAVLTASGWRHF